MGSVGYLAWLLPRLLLLLCEWCNYAHRLHQSKSSPHCYSFPNSSLPILPLPPPSLFSKLRYSPSALAPTPTTVPHPLWCHTHYCATPTTVLHPLLCHTYYCATPTTVSHPLLGHTHYCATPTTVPHPPLGHTHYWNMFLDAQTSAAPFSEEQDSEQDL